jgi:hydroxymethylbilane synthase
LRRDLEIVPIRGNVETRLKKVAAGEVDATFLASAGLARLGILPGVLHWTVLDPFRFVPAPGQGALGVTVREDDEPAQRAFRLIESQPAFSAARCERAVARAVGGNCFVPIGVYAVVNVTQIRVVAALFSEDGRRALRRESGGAAEDAEKIGTSLGQELLAAGGAEIVAVANRQV